MEYSKKWILYLLFGLIIVHLLLGGCSRKAITNPTTNLPDTTTNTLQGNPVYNPLPYEEINHPNGLEEEVYLGYAVGFSCYHRTPLWVSYKITKQWINTSSIISSRPFAKDPNINCSPTGDDYSGSGYNRGHLAPFADMRGRGSLGERQSCYMTNIAPQLARFNQVYWAEFEESIRNYIRDYDYDGVGYVITGSVYYDDGPNWLNEEMIDIPDAFYKIFFDTDEDSILFNWAVLMPHSETINSFSNYSVSIDSIESVTGISFLPLLPDSISAELKERVIPFWFE